MREKNDLWSTAVPSRRQPKTIAASSARLACEGTFRDRQSRFDTRRLRRYGDFIYEVPLVLLWNDAHYDTDYNWVGDDLWDY